MRILIDGYNLLFQSELVGTGRGPGWLDRARQRLIALLHAHLPEDLLARTIVVFDASQTGDSSQDFQSQKGVSIVFSRQHPEADDLLEELIRKHPTPKRLQVVSSDHRIRRCAKARRAQSVDSESFLRSLENQQSSPTSKTKPRGSEEADPTLDATPELTEEQIDFWLKEFGQQ